MKDQLIQSIERIRQQTEILCQPLATEDYVIQSIEDVSPPKWHLAHTSWFFETFILHKHLSTYQPFHPSFHYLFNSYYQGIGNPYPRAKRGLLSRPTVDEIYAYRHYVDNQIMALLKRANSEKFLELSSLIDLGLHHEQQHQELLLMDIKHNFSLDPNFPSYKPSALHETAPVLPSKSPKLKTSFIEMKRGIAEIGYQGTGFCFDNELPRHKKILIPYSISTDLVTNGEYLEFIETGGYQEPHWWLADGWDCVIKNQWQAPLYWSKDTHEWRIFTLHGLTKLNLNEPVSHISYYEADAYARWRGARLPSEEEWEHFVISQGLKVEEGNFMENSLYHPQAASDAESKPQQFFGDLWEWTASSYSPYPAYQPLRGVLGEYNGKFMANQVVLRGGSCATPRSHIRASYRNFFQPDKRWQFSGIRLATS